jgi:hypothetical protein
MTKIICLLLCLIGGSSLAQTSIGPELQVYPTGIIPSIRIERSISSLANLNVRIGYQIIRHRDLGVHEDERGSGYGFSIGYRRFFSTEKSGFSLSLRTDVWKNSIDWKDAIDTPGEVSGSTEITVLQPTILLEDSYRIGSQLQLIPSIGFGYEWNIKTDGAPTGEGAIFLIGAGLLMTL